MKQSLSFLRILVSTRRQTKLIAERPVRVGSLWLNPIYFSVGLIVTLVTFPGAIQAAGHAPLSAAAMAGEKHIALCNGCHEESLDPPKGPPLYGIQMKYKKAHPEAAAFTQAIVDFVSAPTSDRVLMKRAEQKLGLMPALPLPEQQLREIAAYLYEQQFAAPCAHWEIAVKNAEAKGVADDHIARDKMKLKRFCQ